MNHKLSVMILKLCTAVAAFAAAVYCVAYYWDRILSYYGICRKLYCHALRDRHYRRGAKRARKPVSNGYEDMGLEQDQL